MPEIPALRDYLRTRRSVGLGFLRDPGPGAAQLEEILTIGTRVPDHGKVVPWRLVIFEGDARAKAGETVAAILKSRNPAIEDAVIENEKRRFLPAPVTIGVISAPRPHPKAPEIEQIISAGNVCFNLSHAAFALGFASVWVNPWYGFDPEGQQALGARGGERFVGFIHIGTPAMIPEDRERPGLEGIVTRWVG